MNNAVLGFDDINTSLLVPFKTQTSEHAIHVQPFRKDYFSAVMTIM